MKRTRRAPVVAVRGALLLLLLLLSCASVVSAAEACYWIKKVLAGETTTVSLESKTHWKAMCPSGVVRYLVQNTNGNTAFFNSIYSPELVVTPNPTLGFSNGVAYTNVLIDVKCDGLVPLCSSALVVLVVDENTAPQPSSSASAGLSSSVASSSSLSSSSSSSPLASSTSSGTEVPLVCSALSNVETEVGQPATIYPMANVQGCQRPAEVVVISQPSTGLFTTGTDATTGEPIIVFDASGANTAEGTFTAAFRVICDNKNKEALNECVLTQSVVVVTRRETSSASAATPECSGPFSVRATFNTLTQETIAISEADEQLCPVAPGQPRHWVFSNTSLPTHNPESFVLSSNGQFRYLAPPGPPATMDTFSVAIGCAAGEEGSSGEVVYPVCTSAVFIHTTAAAKPLPRCTGDFHYVYTLSSDGSFSPRVSSLAGRASIVRDDNCPDGRYTAVAVVSAPANGTIQGLNAATGEFTYIPAMDRVRPTENMDSFTFQLSCADQPSFVCEATASVAIAAAESEETVYHLYDNLITCKGTCDASSSTRQDGRRVGSMDFNFTSTGKLLIRAYTTISDLQVQFVTFTPIKDTDSYLTFAAAPHGSHVSFEPACLEEQVTYGSASNMLTWENPDDTVTSASQMRGARLNTLTDNYRLGENYFQKFGGKHLHCDTFRENPCKLAPLLTPTHYDDNNNNDDNVTAPVQWRLYVNGCDATWVGEATVESLRALRQPDGQATFPLISGSKISGTVYLQTVTPADIADPSKGVTVTTEAHKLLVTIKNTIIVDAVEVPVPTVSPETRITLAADIQFADGLDRNTEERIYAYQILLYPSRLVNDGFSGEIANEVRLSSFYLDYFAFTSPNRIECPECTGTMSRCKGTGYAYDTNCGDRGIVSFGPIDESSMEYDRAEESPGGTGLFPHTSMSTVYHKLMFAIRANGAHSSRSADAFPVGSFAMVVTYTNGQKFNLTVDQVDYVSEINSKYLRSTMCRASAYWPVPNSLGTSVPIKPFDGVTLSGVTYDASGKPIIEADAQSTAKATYDAPTPLSTKAACSLPASSDVPPTITLPAPTAVVDGVAVSMCAAEDERTYGVTDWFTLSIQEEVSAIQAAVAQAIEQDPSLVNSTSYTEIAVQYIILSINASEAISIPVTDLHAPDGMLNILLDGTNPITGEVTEEDRWIHHNSTVESEYRLYPWAQYASFLNYRRINYEGVGNSTGKTPPLHFSFIPGVLLHSSSSVRVPMQLSLSLRLTTYVREEDTNATASPQTVVIDQEEKLLYVISVSRGISAAMRFDIDAYGPKMVTIKVPGLSRKSATVFLILVLAAVAIVLAASIYIEVSYKRIIHNAKYHPKRPDSAVGVHYGHDGEPTSGEGADDSAVSGRRPVSAGLQDPARKSDTSGAAIKTQFGTIGVEPLRVTDLGDDDRRKAAAGLSSSSRHHKDGGADTRPPIEEEPQRVEDSEVASNL